MKQLLLMRHCKASRSQPVTGDHDRPLNGLGRDAAPVMGQFLLERGPLPDLILCSTAVRAIETVNLLTLSWPPVPLVETDRDLYLTGRPANLSRVARADNNHAVVMLVGHNPDIQLLALSLARNGHASDMKAMAAKFPTGALAHISLAINRWADLPSAIGTLERFVVPKSLLPDQLP